MWDAIFCVMLSIIAALFILEVAVTFSGKPPKAEVDDGDRD